MSKKQKKGNDSGKDHSIQKGKNKVWRLKLGRFVFISIYDLVTWVGIGLCIGLVLIYFFQKDWQGFKWSLVVLGVLVLIMLGIRAKQLGDSDNEKECPELYISGTRLG